MINIKRRVGNLVKKYQTSNPFALAACLGIDVVLLDLPLSIRGFLVRVLRRKIIILNSGLDEHTMSVVLCHELGHARLHNGYGYYVHPDMTYYVPSKREAEANEYAAHLLSYSYDIDGDFVAKVLNDRRPDPKAVHCLLSEIIKN